LLSVTIACALAGCGGSSAASSKADSVGPTFAARALSVCATAQKSKRAWSKLSATDFNPKQPNVQQLPQVAAWLHDQVAPTFDAWLHDLTALGEPPTGQAAWTQVLALVAKIDNLNKAQIDAGQAGKASAFADATNGLEQAQPQLVKATKAAGVGRCAEVHGG
jgi:hypothetical protein